MNRTCRHLWVLTVSLLLAACPAPPVRRPRPPLPPERTFSPTPAPTPTPTRPLEESPLGETQILTPAPEEFPSTPAPSGALPTPPVDEGNAAFAQDESVLAKIGPKTAPNVAAAFRLIDDGRQKMNQHSYDHALDRLERAVAIDPTNPYGYYFLAQVHYLRKNYDQASAFANRAAGLSARADRVFVGRIYALQGAVFEEVGRYPDARKAYEKAVRTDPNNLAARVGVARLGTGE